MLFIKKKVIRFIYKEKSGAVTKLKLVQTKCNQKFTQHKQLYFGTLLLASYCYCGDKHKLWTSFKTLASKEAKIWRLKQFQGNNKLLWKVMSSSYYTE